MTKELQQTPTPIPEEFRAWAKRYADGNSIDAHPGIWEHLNAELYEAAINTYRLLSSQGLRWVKVSEMLPPEDKLVFCRTTRGRKIVTSAAKGEWDNYWLDEDEESVIEWLLDECPAPIQ